MNKLKANSVLATFIFAFSLFVLCSFGTDAAYVILSRYKLQKVTEAVAIEYAASKASDIDKTAETEAERNKTCSEIRTTYKNIYNVLGSGVLVFEIDNMQYKIDQTNDKAVVKVTTISNVMPAFLKFVGVKKVIIHAVACAKTEKISQIKTTSSQQNNENIDSEADSNTNAYVQFDAPFEEDDKSAEIITSKNTGRGDLAIELNYSSEELSSTSGFFIFGGNKVNGEIRWLDIGDKLLENQNAKRVCAQQDVCFYCIANTKAVFDLGIKSGTSGESRRLTNIRVYKTADLSKQPEQEEAEGAYSNFDPCILSCDNEVSRNYNDVSVKLTLLNNVSLIKLSEYNSFTSENLIEGACIGETQ